MDIRVKADHRTEPRCFREGATIVFCGYFSSDKDCGIVFYDQDGKDPIRVRFPEDVGMGRMFSVKIDGVPEDHDRYRLLDGRVEKPDPFAFEVIGLSAFGAPVDENRIFGRIISLAFAENVSQMRHSRIRVRTSPENDLIYQLHVRGFTMSPSAGVEKAHRGTFAGIIDKLDHIEALGATAIELMPAYECVVNEQVDEIYEASDPRQNGREQTTRDRINYWGYKEGFYFAPRSAYASTDAPCQEFLALVEALHKRHLSLILQFWFDRDYPAAMLLAVLRHWVRFYGVDGFHLIGGGLMAEAFSADPALHGVKFYYESIDEQRLSKGDAQLRTLSVYNSDFRTCIRRFAKGDDHSLGRFFGMMIGGSERLGHVNYLASYDGFRLLDSVTYEYRHNEANRENNLDGSADNASWNCGVEGRTRKQSILKLRRKQIFNMLVMLFFAQGTPMLFAGDEFLNTQEGNNNPYCQDNAVSWINWKNENTALGSAAYEFVRFLAAYRKSRHMLTQAKPLKLMDYKAYGFPDLSAHGQDAWQPDLSDYSHSIGLLYCNLYAKEQDPAFTYLICNCHWESRRFALPPVPKNLTWSVVIDTGNTGEETTASKLEKGVTSVLLPARSVMVLETKGGFRVNVKDKRTPF